jgi:hypothetical protein
MQANRARAISAIYDSVVFGRWLADASGAFSSLTSEDGRIEIRHGLFNDKPFYSIYVDGEEYGDIITGMGLDEVEHFAKSYFANVEAAKQSEGTLHYLKGGAK